MMEKKEKDSHDFSNYQKDQINFDLKVNINKKRENNINQLLSLIPGNEYINKKRKKNKNKFNFQSKEKHPEEKDQYKRLLEKRKHLLQKSFTFRESNTNFIKDNKEQNQSFNHIDIITKEINSNKEHIKKENLLYKAEEKNKDIQFTLINTSDIKYIPDYEPWDKELLEIILSNNDNNNNILNNYSSLSEEELNKLFLSEISNNDSKLLELISYTQHPIPQSNYSKDKEDSTNLQFMLTKKEKRSLKKIYQDQKRKDEQEKIKLGLMKPKKAKLKYTNMIQLFRNEAITNPSQMYQTVQNAYKEREKKMLEENEKNKLTKEQRRIKFREKIDKDQEAGLYGYFFQIKKIYDIENYNRFNSWIKIFCKKYKLSGFLIHFFKQNENFAYIEGGQKALNKINKRINNKLKIEQNNIKAREENKKIKEKGLNQENQDKEKINKKKKIDDNKIENNINNNKEISGINNEHANKDFSCFLKWKGLIKKKSFYHFQVLIKQNHHELLEFLEENNLIHLSNNID